jgi:hypothetical protein
MVTKKGKRNRILVKKKVAASHTEKDFKIICRDNTLPKKSK